MKNLDLKNITKIARWQLFSIEEALNVTSPKITQPQNVIKDGNNKTPRTSASILNNGIENFYSNPPDNQRQVIVVNTAAKPFFLYEGFDFFTSGDICPN